MSTEAHRIAEAEIAKIRGDRGIRTRAQAAGIYVKSLAETIADDVIEGNDQWQPRLDRYVAAKAIRDALYEDLDAMQKRIG